MKFAQGRTFDSYKIKYKQRLEIVNILERSKNKSRQGEGTYLLDEGSPGPQCKEERDPCQRPQGSLPRSLK